MSDLVERLEPVWVQNLRSFIRGQTDFGDEWRDIFVERLEATVADNARLQEALAAAEAERDEERRLRTEMAERFFMPLGEPDPTETRKKALEEAANWHEQQHAALGSKPVWQMLSCHLEYAAAIRALAEEVRT